MEVIYTLIPGMIFLGLIMVGILIWAVKKGQYEDLDGDANRILMDDDDPLLPENQKEKKKGDDRRNWPDADEG
ncbi:Type cbb3 cytochrome oxidase biogenesis protein CcoS, involved in heme b insertion [hydrothermal vent metagenome]|uniref:Type cbb3 cytochrome oxidase biogenesis protein CcoS, involved in heme b insertion n=1 Tax=hydrothermal vent metagenome TaxID=652676 RepID=A0A3B1BTD4_9ZZZZ